MNPHISFFNHVLGTPHVLWDESQLAPYLSDWTKIRLGSPLCVVKPASTSEVSQVMAYCHQHHLSVVTTGGRTGLAGGAVMTDGCVGLSLERMNKIHPIDSIGRLVKVEAGVTTEQLQNNVEEQGFYYGVDLGSRGSCQIGGNIATNAGGLKYIRHAGTREQLLGLEVVLADGTVLDLNRELYKNNIGFNILHLMVGSEGTLGVITQATLKLHDKPSELALCCLAASTLDDVLEIYQWSRRMKLCLTAFEFYTDKAVERVKRHTPDRLFPFEQKTPFYALIECEKDLSPMGMEPFIEGCFEKGWAVDGVVATSHAEFRSLWGWRENITESLAATGLVRKNDLCLPHAALSPFVEAIQNLKRPEGVEFVMFGHIGDGNIHLNYHSYRDSSSSSKFSEVTQELEKHVYELVTRFRGSISAEHGVGYLKRDDLLSVCSSQEIAYMKAIKKIFDPKGLLNPGKLL